MEELGGGTPAREAGAAAREVDLSLLLDSVQEAFARSALDGTIEFVSAGARTVYGREPDELIGTQGLDLVDPVDHAEAALRLARLGESEGREERMTVRVRRPDGSIAWADSTARSVRDPATGELFIAIVAREATQRVETQDALSRVEERFRELVEWVPAVVYEAAPGPEGVFHYISPQIEEMLGYTPAEWLADPRLWFESIHPDDRGPMLELEREQEEQSRESDRRLASEYRMLHRNGRTVWVRDIARTSRLRLPGRGRRPRSLGVRLRPDRAAGRLPPSGGDRRPNPVVGMHPRRRSRTGRAGRGALGGDAIGERVRARVPAAHSDRQGDLDPRPRDRLPRRPEQADDGGRDHRHQRRARRRGGSLGLADVYRLSCGDCGATWAAERIERCRQCQSQNVEGVSLNAALNDLAASRQQVEGLLDGIQRHLDALGTNLRSGSAQLSADDPAERTQ